MVLPRSDFEMVPSPLAYRLSHTSLTKAPKAPASAACGPVDTQVCALLRLGQIEVGRQRAFALINRGVVAVSASAGAIVGMEAEVVQRDVAADVVAAEALEMLRLVQR